MRITSFVVVEMALFAVSILSPNTFYFGYTNGNLGYLPTRGAWEEGGYETTVSPFTPSAEDDVKEAVIGYLHGELRAPSSGANETTAATVPANKN